MNGTVKTLLSRAWLSWNRFWFEADGHAQMRLFRKLFAGLLLLNYSLRTLDLELYYSDRGIAPLSVLPEIMDLRYRFSLLHVLSGTTALWVFDALFLLSLATLMLGILPRISAIVALVLHVSFLHRNMASAYGADTVATFFLLYLSLADFRFRTAKDVTPDFRSSLGSVAFRLGQIQLCIIYAYAGLHKLKGVNWWNGEALWGTLANAQMARFDFGWMAHFPVAMIVATYATLFWEIYFPVLIWARAVRYGFLVFGVLVHLGIGVALNIPIFASLMVFIYALFLDPAHAVAIENLFKKFALRPISPMSGAERNFGGYSRPRQLD